MAHRESVVEKYLRQGVRRLGGVCWKWVSPGRRAVPDRIVLMPGGLIDFVEVKRDFQFLNAQQEFVHKTLKDLGHNVITLDGQDMVKLYLSTLQERAERHAGQG